MNAVDRERLQFALEILDREPDAHRILADFLEEHGDVGHAQWARGKKSSARKRLEFAISLLPAGEAVRLGCDFVERAVDGQQSGYLRSEAIVLTLSTIRDAVLEGPASVSTALRQAVAPWRVESLWAYQEIPRSWEPAARALSSFQNGSRHLNQAVLHCANGAELGAAGDTRRAKHADDQCRHAIRNVARHCREAVRSTGEATQSGVRRWWPFGNADADRPAAPHPSSVKAGELRWQMERTQSVIEELLNATE